MMRRARVPTALASLLLVVALGVPAFAIDEPDRLWLVGERAAADGLHALARRALEQFVERYPNDARVGPAWLLLGKTRLAMGDADAALDALRRAQAVSPPPGRPLEAKFWEAEALFRLKRFSDAAAAYDTVVRTDAASPFAPDALYGYAWSELEQKRPADAVTGFRELLKTWPEHSAAASARFYLARALVDLKKPADAITELQTFLREHPDHKLAPDARYLLGWSRIQTGDFRGGVADLRKFVDANPSHDLAPGARRLILDTTVRHGDRDELQQAYRTLMAQTPPTPEGLADAATIAGKLGRPQDQDAAWRKLRAQFPDHPLARRAAFEQASAAFNRKDWKTAATLGRVAAQSADETVRGEAWLLAGESELKLKNWSAAARAFDAALQVKSMEPAARYRALAGLGLAREEQREWRAALTAYESVASKSPDATLRNWAKERADAVKSQIAKSVPKTKSGS